LEILDFELRMCWIGFWISFFGCILALGSSE